VGLTFYPTTKIFLLENLPMEKEESYVSLTFSNDYKSDMSNRTTPTPIVAGNFASVLSDMCSTA